MKSVKFEYPGNKTPEGIGTKLVVSNYVGHPTLTSKYESNVSVWVVSAVVVVIVVNA